MSSVYPRKAVNGNGTAALTPPMTPSSSKTKASTEDSHIPADIDIPDNYVAHTLKTQKALPPISWDNWYREANWLNVAILSMTPVIGLVGAMFTKLRWETCLFSIFYYYVTGLGLFFSSSA